LYSIIENTKYTGRGGQSLVTCYGKLAYAYNGLAEVGEPAAQSQQARKAADIVEDPRLAVAKAVVQSDPVKYNTLTKVSQSIMTAHNNLKSTKNPGRQAGAVGTDKEKRKRGGGGKGNGNGNAKKRKTDSIKPEDIEIRGDKRYPNKEWRVIMKFPDLLAKANAARKEYEATKGQQVGSVTTETADEIAAMPAVEAVKRIAEIAASLSTNQGKSKEDDSSKDDSKPAAKKNAGDQFGNPNRGKKKT
jgi:hypothetical protein